VRIKYQLPPQKKTKTKMNNDPVAKSIELGRRAMALSALKPVSLPEWPESKRATPQQFSLWENIVNQRVIIITSL
jgi:hypothetical protein